MHDLRLHIEQQWSKLTKFKLYLACSGGVDSIVLLHILRKADLSITVLHVNYQLRGEDSNLDENIVKDTCHNLGVQCEVRKVNLDQKLQRGNNLQERARDIRYNWFKEILAQHPKNRILLGHHADDQVETFFLNIARKSGVMGLACMKSENNRIIRPLLDFAKTDLINYANSNQIEWREDASNASMKYRRNRLRNEIIPGIKTIIPSIDNSILILIKSFQDLQESLENTVRPIVESISETDAISMNKYGQLNSLERIELFRALTLSANVAIRIESLRNGEKGKRVEISHANYKEIVRDHDQFSFVRKSSSIPQLICEASNELPSSFSKKEIFLDASKLNGQLKLRNWELEDRIYPIGMHGSQLISDIIKDAKLTAHQKQNVMVVYDDEGIHWCIDLKIGRLALATSNTTEIIKCTLAQ